MAAWQQVRGAGIAEAERTLAQRDDAAELRRLVGGWLDATDAAGPSTPAVAAHPATAALADAFARKSLDCLADAVRLLDQGVGPIPPGRWLLALLLGRAAADRVAAGFAAGERRRPTLFGLEAYGAWKAFTSALPDHVQMDEASRGGFWRALGSLVDATRAEPERGAVPTYGASVRADVATYQQAPEVAEAWESRLDAYVLTEDRYLFGVARRLDAARYLEHLAHLPHPVFVAQCLDLGRDASLPALVRAAPPAFDPAGAYRSEGMVVVALLGACAAECRRLAWGEPGEPRPVAADEVASAAAGSELGAFIETLMEALFERGDAAALGWLWLERLVFEGERRGLWRLDRTRGAGWVLDPLMSLVFALAAKLEPRSDRLTWVGEARDLWRIDRIAAVLAVAAAHPTERPEAGEALLREVLVGVEPAYAGAAGAMERPDCVVGRIGARHVLASDDPARLVRDLWDKLRPTRERAWRTEVGQVRNDAAELAVLWATCAMEAAQGGRKRDLWMALQDVLEQAMQTDEPSSHGGFWPAALRRLCRSTPAVLAGAPDEDAEVLAELLGPRVRADDLLFGIVFALQDVGVDPLLLKAAVAHWGLELAELAQRYLTIEMMRIERGEHTRPWLDRVRSLVPVASSM